MQIGDSQSTSSVARPLRVVAALNVLTDGRFLLHRRPIGKARGGLWELPGGKVEPGEKDAEALVRECHEELGVTVEVGELRADVVHRYNDISVHVLVYAVCLVETLASGPSLDGGAVAYFDSRSADVLMLCDADRCLLTQLSLLPKV